MHLVMCKDHYYLMASLYSIPVPSDFFITSTTLFKSFAEPPISMATSAVFFKPAAIDPERSWDCGAVDTLFTIPPNVAPIFATFVNFDTGVFGNNSNLPLFAAVFFLASCASMALSYSVRYSGTCLCNTVVKRLTERKT